MSNKIKGPKTKQEESFMSISPCLYINDCSSYSNPCLFNNDIAKINKSIDNKFEDLPLGTSFTASSDVKLTSPGLALSVEDNGYKKDL